MNSSSPAELIQQRMNAMRYELKEDAAAFVDNTRVRLDWRYYVQRHPWLCLGAAFAAGVWIVPTRVSVMRPDAATLKEVAQQNRLVVAPEGQEPKGLRRSLLTWLGSLAARQVMSFAGQQVARFFVNQVDRAPPQTPVEMSPQAVPTGGPSDSARDENSFAP